MEQESTPATSIAAGSGWYSSAARERGGLRRTPQKSTLAMTGPVGSGPWEIVGASFCGAGTWLPFAVRAWATVPRDI